MTIKAVGIFEEKKYDRKAFFVRQGFNNGKIAFVANGIFRVFFVTENGREFTKHFSDQNELMLSNVDPVKNSRVNIQAMTDAVVVEASHEAFLDLCGRCKEMAELRGRIIDAYLTKKEAREINLLSNDVKTNYSIFQKEYRHLLKRIPQYYVATACRVIQAPVRSIFDGRRSYVAPSDVRGILLAYPTGTLSVS